MKIFKPPIVEGFKRNTSYNFFNSNFNIDSKPKWFDELSIKYVNEINENYFNYLSPSLITNSIFYIKFNDDSINIKKIHLLMEFYEKTICKHLTIIIIGFISLKKIKQIFKIIQNYNIHSVLMVCEYLPQYYTDEFGELVMNLSINKKLIVLNSPFEKNFEDTMFFTLKKKIGDFKKTFIEFNASITLFSESQKHQTYFNRKLYIGPNGEIKNAPECDEIFGNINVLESVEDLKKIISIPAFQKYWFVHKEITDVCKDCEFRHMCVDNRLPYKRSKEEWYHKIECNYNPYIAKWEGEEGYRTLSECGLISNEHEFSIDHEKIAQINKELWENED